MATAAEISGLIGTVYDAIFEPARWGTVLERVCGTIDATAASIHMLDPVDGQISMYIEHGADPTWTALLMTKYAAMSPIGAAVLLSDIDQPVGAFDFIDEEEFVDSRFYREWCEPQGYFDMVGAVIAKRPRAIGAIGATRRREAGRFGAAEREFVGLLAPHIRRSVTISGLLDRRNVERQALAGVIDLLDAAVIVIGPDARIERANAAGEALLAAGGAVRDNGGRLAFTDRDAQAALQAGLLAEGSPPPLFSVPAADGARFVGALLAIDGRDRLFALFLKPEEDELPPIGRHLAALFGLTPREVAVLMPLLKGRTPSDVAQELGVSVATVRTHLNRLFSKTGTERQPDLVRVVLQAIPPVRLT